MALQKSRGDEALKKQLLVSFSEKLAPGMAFPCSDEKTHKTCVVRTKV